MLLPLAFLMKLCLLCQYIFLGLAPALIELGGNKSHKFKQAHDLFSQYGNQCNCECSITELTCHIFLRFNGSENLLIHGWLGHRNYGENKKWSLVADKGKKTLFFSKVGHALSILHFGINIYSVSILSHSVASRIQIGVHYYSCLLVAWKSTVFIFPYFFLKFL